MRNRVSEDAERDLDETFVYRANRASPETADRVVDRITERFWLPGEYPDAGKPARDIAASVKCLPQESISSIIALPCRGRGRSQETYFHFRTPVGSRTFPHLPNSAFFASAIVIMRVMGSTGKTLKPFRS
jgi:plasmid stabilization system protein ParE